MFLNEPVFIPEVPGKIVIKKKGENSYVLFETGKRYDPERQYNIVERKMIGIQIPDRPELMMANENYLEYFGEGEAENRTEEQEGMLLEYAEELERGKTLRAFFDKVYFEFLHMSRRTPEYPVSLEKVRRINRILRPLMEMMKGEAFGEFLELIPEAEEGEERQMTCSDVAIMLTIFKTALERYFMRKM